MMRTSRILTLALGAALFAGGAFVATDAFADENGRVGPLFGNNRYRGSITDGRDEDEFVQDLLQGEKLQVFVQSVSALKPLLTLVDPDGIVRFPDVRVSDDGFSTFLPEFTIDKSGRWAARVASADGSSGAYEVKFKLRTIGAITAKNEQLGNDQPFARTHEFSAFEGAILDAKLTFDPRQLPVEFRAVNDPAGDPVMVGDTPAFQTAQTRGNRVTLQNILLGVGEGTYAVRVRTPTGTAKYTLKLRVTPAVARPSSKIPGVLTDLEPSLDVRSAPLGGDVGSEVTLTGVNFSVSPPPIVLFDKAAAPNVVVAPDGRSLTCNAPERSGAEVVSVTVVNPDGQASCRSLYFAYVPPPEVFDIVDANTLQTAHGGSTAGGRALILQGDNLLPGQILRFGGVTATDFTVTSETTATFTLPASPVTGNVDITVTDSFTRVETAPFQLIFYKNPPVFAAQPYSPGAVTPGAAAVVTISGTNFEATDQLEFNGAPIASTFIGATSRTVSLPALAEGNYPVTLVDSVGSRVDGPLLSAKYPPTLSSVTVTAGAFLTPNEIPLAGGSTITVAGTNFAPSDIVVFGGATISTFTARTATTFAFTAPAHAQGLVSISVTDGAGQSASLPNIIRYVGFENTTSTRAPAGAAADNLTGWRVAAGDLDRDGAADDVLVGSRTGDASHGSESRKTRLFLGNASGRLANATSGLPAARTDPNTADNWDATCIAIGDVDNANGNDFVIGGDGANAASYYTQYKEIRLFKQTGTAGTFSFDYNNSPPVRYAPGVTATDNYGFGYQVTIYGSLVPGGRPAAIAIGDVDNDGRRDIVAAHDAYDGRYIGLDPNSPYIYDYGGGRLYVSFRAMYYGGLTYINAYQYIPGLRIFKNQTNGSFTDVSGARLPGAGDGTDPTAQPSALQARDMILVNVEKGSDTDLDIVLIWDDPETTTAYGRYTKEVNGSPEQPPQRALEILVNSGSGSFTNVSASALPNPTGNEYYQGGRVRAADLDNDGDQDLVILCDVGLDAWTGTATTTASCLRVLRNDGSASAVTFTNVTSSAIPLPLSSTGDNFRGNALLLRDVNGDTLVDILVGTSEELSNPSNGQAMRGTRLFTNATGLRFRLQQEFQVATATDTAEASEIFVVPDLGGAGLNPVLVTNIEQPRAPSSGGAMRAAEWKR
ncbi:MAG: hypothetical protein HMLKMBBP_01995 [Planctomycetes bacterium]|nr:hypothetical protein [Planctomycetota bacterium]